MPSESLQHKLDRVRPPRVQITYDVETGGAMQKVELPFVVGVLADLSGQPSEPLKPLKERKFVAIDRDNIDEVLRRSKPRIAFNVPNRVANDDTKLPIALTFSCMEDFEPANVAKNIGVLAELLKARSGLTHLLGKMEGNDQLEMELAAILGDAGKTKELADALGVKPKTLPASPSPAPGTEATSTNPSAAGATSTTTIAAPGGTSTTTIAAPAAPAAGVTQADPQAQDPSKVEDKK